MFVFDRARMLLLSLVIHSCFVAGKHSDEEIPGYLLKTFCGDIFEGRVTFLHELNYPGRVVYLHEVVSSEPKYLKTPVKVKDYLYSDAIGYRLLGSVEKISDNHWFINTTDLREALNSANPSTKKYLDWKNMDRNGWESLCALGP
ncbi:unnamed protein product [Cylicocyclus nassatus]|uniref:Uncharacterized protein n=1 Tax=Cylicocyclus nassatus TaxID=53992 RepID=A0AA36GJL6_CYLNA|nr:unnamed protein product [Cylicocyclus nassatus]